MTDTTSRIREEQDDLTLKDLILACRRFWLQAVRAWWLYGIAFALIGGFFIWRALNTPETYQAKLTFMLNEDEGNPFGGITGVLGSFGLGRRGGAGRFNLDKLVELARSRKIVEQVILTKCQNDFLGNTLIDEYDLATEWAANDPEMEGFRFTHDSVPGFNKQERMALLSLYALIIGGEKNTGLANPSYNDISSILSLT